MTTNHTNHKERTFTSRYGLPEVEHPPLLAFITDCQDDFAKTKVEIAKLSAFGKNWHLLDTIGIPSFATHVLGIQAAVIAGYLGDYSNEHEEAAFLIANSAPREKGEGLIGGEIFIAVLDNGVPVLVTNGPGALTPFANHIEQLWKIEVDQIDWLPETQFRSFAWFSELAQKFVYGDPALIKTYIEDISTYVIPHEGAFCWLDDSFGNVKLTLTENDLNELGIEDGDQITLRIGDYAVVVDKRDKLFPLPEGAGTDHIGLYKGSDKDLDGNHYYELAIAHKSARAWIEDHAQIIDEQGNEITSEDAARLPFFGGESVEVIGIVKAAERDRPATESVASRPQANGASNGLRERHVGHPSRAAVVLDGPLVTVGSLGQS